MLTKFQVSTILACYLMDGQMHSIGKAIRPLFADQVTYYRKHESSKKRAYESRFREVEHNSFTPLVFSASGGMGPEATVRHEYIMPE